MVIIEGYIKKTTKLSCNRYRSLLLTEILQGDDKMTSTNAKEDIAAGNFDLLRNEDLQIGLFEFLLRARDDLLLPPYKGNTLRGGLGNALKKIVCALEGEDCDSCAMKSKCVFQYIFDTSPPPGSPKLSNLRDIPRPFVIEPPLDMRESFERGEYLKFNLILAGNSINYYPYFIAAFQELGKIGIGKRRFEDRRTGRYELVKIYSMGNDGERKVIFDGDEKIVYNSYMTFDGEKFANPGFTSKDSVLKFRFLTPTKICIKKELVRIPTFENIIIILTRRVNNILRFHCGIDEEWNFKEFKEKASKVKMEYSSLNWVEYDRYSSRKDRREKMEGFTGEIAFSGDFIPFIPFLKMGELLHLGKGATWGMGKYRMEIRGN